MIEFNRPPYIGTELDYVKEAVERGKLCGDGEFTKKCSALIRDKFGAPNVLMTTSCTHALEMAAYLCHLRPGDEVIMPSFTFVSTANAFVLWGAKVVFVDIRPDTMNINEQLIEDAITERTKVIVPVHYAGVGCDMDTILDIARRHNLMVVEDAAQGVNAYYKGKALGTFGDFGCYSFHETKNYTMGEGGAIVIKDHKDMEDAEILREKGTDRSRFFRGQVDKYTWVSYGSSYLPSDMNAAYLYAQLEQKDMINEKRLQIWNLYDEMLRPLRDKELIEQPFIPEECTHNAHMYYIKLKDIEERQRLIGWLKERGVMAVFHYLPLHSAAAGLKYCRFHGEDRCTTRESERLLRLPMFYNLSLDKAEYAAQCVLSFFENV